MVSNRERRGSSYCTGGAMCLAPHWLEAATEGWASVTRSMRGNHRFKEIFKKRGLTRWGKILSTAKKKRRGGSYPIRWSFNLENITGECAERKRKGKLMGRSCVVFPFCKRNSKGGAIEEFGKGKQGEGQE